MKTCKDCGKEKDQCEFYGSQGECKECTKRRVKKHREENLDEIRAYDRKRGRTEKRKKLVRLYQIENAAIVARAKKKWIKRNPEKRKAHLILNNAIRSGKIIKKPCTACGEKRAEAHHPDYSKPLEVVWLCSRCHGKFHRKYD